MAKIKTKTEVVERKKTTYETTDGKKFKNFADAERHQYDLDYEQVAVDLPLEVRLGELARWVNALIAAHGTKAVFGHHPSSYGDPSYVVVKKRKI